MFSFNGVENIATTLKNKISHKKISILCPFYNEKELIISTIDTIIIQMRKWGFNFELILSDDGSTDGSSDLIRSHCNYPELILVQSFRNYGKGRALLTAFGKCSGDYVLFLDSDLELPLEHLPFFLHEMIKNNKDIIIGSKAHPDSNIKYPFIRKIMSKGFAILSKILLNLPLPDTQTGIKLFKKEVLDQTFASLVVKKFAFDLELLTIAHNKGFSIETHPIILKFVREETLGRMTLDTVLHMFKDTFAIAWRLKSGFWKGINLHKKSMKHAVIALSRESKIYSGDVFYCDEYESVEKLILSLEGYDTVAFAKKGDEIPVFANDTLDNLFTNEKIQVLIPLVYPKSDDFEEEFYYITLGNLFFPMGFYGYYRPVKFQNVISQNYDYLFHSTNLVYRYDYLKKLLEQKNNNLPHKIRLGKYFFTSPYYIVHKELPRNDNEFRKYLAKMSTKRSMFKKICVSASMFSLLVGVIGIMIWDFTYFIPFIIIQIIIHSWYILSLGIRKGIRYLVRFDFLKLKLALGFFMKKNK